MSGESWLPTTAASARLARATLYQAIRHYFQTEQVLEVETPILGRCGVTDPHLDSIATAEGFLQTSPEYAMKRLLAAGSGSIYQISKAFRAAEVGSRHNPEFSLLEWYRVDFDHHQLMADVVKLLEAVGIERPTKYYTYQALLQQYLHLDPLACLDSELEECLRSADITLPQQTLPRDALLDLAMVSLVEPQLPKDELVFVYDYPASQAALARLSKIDSRVAHRFECYLSGVELANGFYELADASEQAVRFVEDNRIRRALGKSEMKADQRLLGALASGTFPECAGVALGLDRLLMVLVGANDIASVLNFPCDFA